VSCSCRDCMWHVPAADLLAQLSQCLASSQLLPLFFVAKVLRPRGLSWRKIIGFPSCVPNIGGKLLNMTQWPKSHSSAKVNRTIEIGPKYFGLDLGIELKYSKMWVRQDYIRIYDYCSKRHEAGPSSATQRARCRDCRTTGSWCVPFLSSLLCTL
jgi:hypothetical protein